jgi:serine-type D-Ala-D-Ala carboxypeptidase/endopeptidase (penicillin-binding protein 4)
MKKNYLLSILFAWLQLVLLTNCQPKYFSQKSFSQRMEQDSVYKNDFTGVSVYDVNTKQYIVNHNADKYFTPASTTKLFTFYAALKLLGNKPDLKLPALKYIVKKDSLVFFGTGNPTTLHLNFTDSTVWHFLKNRKENLYFSENNWKEDFFGMGWSWDDFNDYYSPERSAMPLYGNIITFTANLNKPLTFVPSFFKYDIFENKNANEAFFVQRNLRQNFFFYINQNIQKKQVQEVPFITSAELTAKLLSDTLRKVVYTVKYPMPKTGVETLFAGSADTVLRRMMQVSDNFLAEQILLMCAAQNLPNAELNTAKVIDLMLTTHLAALTDKPRWVDGSGLSRMNLFTPRSQVELLQKIYATMAINEAGEKRLFGLLAVGGGHGTLQGRFKSEKPFIFGKSGSLSNNVNLSGYLLTKSGKKLIFSFMNNHYIILTSRIRKRMDEILLEFYEKY